ncbi:protein-methionine-sulfoxide reductase catalytic subunit MsrP [Malaciobacter molluscorum LMG 25693]|uniref:Protein-methionine-sulfoxide reductase catalytic subunit MsrP n=1 Tax=Malaciobacter molluscorum LMG 25693 TaxID=870501 RepID=A0A2G1DJI8_9BACT|nr:protein-methionine-sulfoxide reductase catalytic subunit MsrP [Malaciobacter molluscorum]AXX91595.1 periplasmic DMSO/TMAO reductase YedYZ, molybdopterin-dependent catalytic subunit [Malaciobacter molluscorum LMG 25693]PHO18610.1 protein-methionine-sulfoxide reductase catalytic subunit MsrP [Malaciobacter molluscorum LMG 25693]RXJ94559.1 protein-methionine-sulfoxide reductase catalytic subunit MsrP [Malaciobacter molluscorum]
MKYIKTKQWQIKESEVTSKTLFNKRRDFIKLGAASLVSSGAIFELLAKDKIPLANLQYKKDKNENNLTLNSYEQITSHNNFYEFTTNQSKVKDMAHTLDISNWKIKVDGLVEKPMVIDFETIMKKFPLEERIYRFRCVEGWAMVVPWIGFELSKLIKYLKPLSSAKYIKFETLYDEKMFPDQARGILSTISYPYVEALRMDEAMNELTILAVGLYGSSMPKQNGAPIRLIVPWKYGFKSIKSISKISFVDKQPLNSWQKENKNEYGFYANVNPYVDHPRWSQSKERVLGKFFKQRTLMFNGYEKQVASLYKGMDLTKDF